MIVLSLANKFPSDFEPANILYLAGIETLIEAVLAVAILAALK
jgi:hypothetical protein